MLSTATKTIEKVFEYDEDGNVTKERVTTTDGTAAPRITTVSCSDADDIEAGIELDGAFGMSTLDVFLTAAIGAFVGNVLFSIFRKS